MAASSSSSSPVVAPMNSTQHQVFINFRGKDIRKEFVKSLVDEMKAAGINVFIDEFEVRGLGLEELFVRIQESEVAIVIFSENYGNSEWCLNELVKINECVSNRTLMAIPVFYKLEVSNVKDIEGDFGIHFRALKRINHYDAVKTQKWERAIASISAKHGMALSAHGEISDGIFIDKMIGEVKRSLEHIAQNANQRGQPEQIQRRQYDTVQIHSSSTLEIAGQRQSFMVNARQLKIEWSELASCWTFMSVHGEPNGAAIEVAKMNEVWFLHVSGFFHTKVLTPGTRYEVVFVVKVDDTLSGWDSPAKLELMVPHGNEKQEQELSFDGYIRNEWVDIRAGVFVAPLQSKKITFTLSQHETDERKTGLQIKGVAIRPTQ